MQDRKNSDVKTEPVRKTLSDLYEVAWPGYAPTEHPRPIPQFERTYDYPFGTTRRGSNPGIDYLYQGKRCRQLPYKFFKPASLRQEEHSDKNLNAICLSPK